MESVTAFLKIALFGILLSFLTTPAFSARILGIIPTPSLSHHIVFRPLWRELSLRGHQVTVVTTDPINDPSLTNLTEISLHSAGYGFWNRINMVSMRNQGKIFTFRGAARFAEYLMEVELRQPELQALIKNESEHFDLLLVETMFPAMVAFAERFKCPFIGIASLDVSAYVHSLIGNPAHPILNPDYMLPFAGELTFYERLISTFYTFSMHPFHSLLNFPTQELVIEKYFGKRYPPLSDIFENMSLLFINTNPIFHPIRPLVPAVVQLGGGIHIQPPKPLPKHLQKTLDDAKQGFIYFSLGSNVKSIELSESSLRILLETFSELPYKVLWKFEMEDLPGKPDNVIISKWFPQQDIFRHPNIKLFITQGGLQSVEEAVYSGVPLIGMPFIGDQPTNVKKMVAIGLGLSVDYETLDKASLKAAILEVIDNPKYRNRVEEIAVIVKDQPMTGLERAVWWTEYVLRHKGAPHLRSPALDLPLYRYLLLDVIGFCILVLALAVLLIVSAVKIFLRLVGNFKLKQKLKEQ